MVTPILELKCLILNQCNSSLTWLKFIKSKSASSNNSADGGSWLRTGRNCFTCSQTFTMQLKKKKTKHLKCGIFTTSDSDINYITKKLMLILSVFFHEPNFDRTHLDNQESDHWCLRTSFQELKKYQQQFRDHLYRSGDRTDLYFHVVSLITCDLKRKIQGGNTSKILRCS